MLGLLAITAAAAATDVDWVAQFASTTKEATHHPADALRLLWTGDHAVARLRDRRAWEACDFAGAAELGSASPVTVRGDAAEEIFLACPVGDHCRWGLKLAVSWGRAPTGAPSTSAPSAAPTLKTEGPTAAPMSSIILLISIWHCCSPHTPSLGHP